MADDPELAERVRRALDGVAGVTEQRMFGSLGFLVAGTLRFGVGTHSDHVMMVRLGDAAEEALRRPGAAPAVMRGRPMRGWAFLTREAVDADDGLAYWVATGLAAVPAP